MEDSLKKRYSIKLLASIVSGIIATILIAIIPKALGPIAYGQFVYLQDFFAKVIGFLDMGSSIAFFTKLSANQKRKELILFYFIYSFVILVVILLFMFLMFYFDFLKVLFPNIPIQYIYMGLIYGFLTWFTHVFIKISDAYALTVSVELIKIMHKVFSLFLLLSFLYFLNFDLTYYFYFHYISLGIFFIVLTWFFIKKGIFQNLKFKTLSSNFITLIKEFISYCHPLVVYSFLGLIVGFLDIWMLQKFGGSIETGFYGLAYGLAAMSFLFTGAMTPIITREFSKSYAQNDLNEMKKLFYRYIPMLYALATYFSAFMVMQSENVLDIFTGKEFEDAYFVLMIMAFYPIHQTYGQLSGSVFYATEQTKLLRNIAFFTQPLGMFISFTLIYLFDLGAIGLAWKMVMIQLIGVTIQLYFNAKFLKLNMKYFIFHQFYVLIIFLCMAFFASSISISSLPLVNFLFSGLIYTFFVILLVFIFPQIFGFEKDEIYGFLKRLKNVIKTKVKK